MKSWPRCAASALLLLIVVAAGSAQAGERYMVPNPMLGTLPEGVEPIHDYGQRSLIRVPAEHRQALDLRRASRLENVHTLSYRSWQARVQERPESLAPREDAYFILALTGPLDPAWRGRLQDYGSWIMSIPTVWWFTVTLLIFRRRQRG